MAGCCCMKHNTDTDKGDSAHAQDPNTISTLKLCAIALMEAEGAEPWEFVAYMQEMSAIHGYSAIAHSGREWEIIPIGVAE